MEESDLLPGQRGRAVAGRPDNPADRPPSVRGAQRGPLTASSQRLVLTGDLDDYTFPGLTAALARTADSSAEIHIDLAAVTYCDLASLRMIVGLNKSNGQHPARHVVLHHLPAYLHEVLAILGWDAAPALTIEPDDGEVSRGRPPITPR